jgi:protein-tyrosine phosphatase
VGLVSHSTAYPPRTDLHFHLLPEVDDGPSSLEESIALARAAVADGTCAVLATPHVGAEQAGVVSELPARVGEMRAVLQRERIPLAVVCGGELSHELVGRLSQTELETIAWGPPGARRLLLECPFDGFGADFHGAADELRARGFGILLAHPERSSGITPDDGRPIARELARGALVQLNAGSLAGRHGALAQELAGELLRRGQVAVLASDAHAGGRGPVLSAGMAAAISAGVDPSAVAEMVSLRPTRLLGRFSGHRPKSNGRRRHGSLHPVHPARRRFAPLHRQVTLVTTVGNRTLDDYSLRLAARLSVPKVFTRIYTRNADLFNVPLLSRSSVRAVVEDTGFVRRLRELKGPVHFTNQHMGRYARLLDAKYVITVHDVIRYLDLNGGRKLIHEPNLRDRFMLGLDYAGIRRASALIAVSGCTKKDLIENLGVRSDRVFVVYEGVDHAVFQPRAERMLDCPYVLFVGSEQPRKNFIGLLNAFARLKQGQCHRDLVLVKVGSAGGPEAPFRRRTLRAIRDLGLEEDVLLRGRVSTEELVAWYSGASCFALPSLYEGFGFPPLEAMACGCPAVVSDSGSLPEVTGGAALVVSTGDDRALAEALADVLEDDSLRAELVSSGFERASEFTWERAACETEAVYRSVLESA